MPAGRPRGHEPQAVAVRGPAARRFAGDPKADEGITVARTLHRIEEAVVRREVEAAGFNLSCASARLCRRAGCLAPRAPVLILQESR